MYVAEHRGPPRSSSLNPKIFVAHLDSQAPPLAVRKGRTFPHRRASTFPKRTFQDLSPRPLGGEGGPQPALSSAGAGRGPHALQVVGVRGSNRLRKNSWRCHSEPAFGAKNPCSLLLSRAPRTTEVLRCAQDDSIAEFFRSLLSPDAIAGYRHRILKDPARSH